jgi:hypothetical protein
MKERNKQRKRKSRQIYQYIMGYTYRSVCLGNLGRWKIVKDIALSSTQTYYIFKKEKES